MESFEPSTPGARHDLSLTLRNWRLHRRMTQKQLAIVAGVHRCTVAMIEQKSTNPTLNVLERLSTALKIPVACLLMPVDYLEPGSVGRHRSPAEQHQQRPP